MNALPSDADMVYVGLTKDEARALLQGCTYINAFEGPPPSPPTPGMTAQAKLERALAVAPGVGATHMMAQAQRPEG